MVAQSVLIMRDWTLTVVVDPRYESTDYRFDDNFLVLSCCCCYLIQFQCLYNGALVILMEVTVPSVDPVVTRRIE